MKTFVLLVMGTTFAVTATAAKLDKAAVVELDKAARASKTVGEFVTALKPSLSAPWSDVLVKNSESAAAQKLSVVVKAPGSFNAEKVPVQVVDLEAGRYSMNRKPYALDAAKTPEQVWEDVKALLPKDSSAVAFAVGAIASIDGWYTNKNCTVYGTEMGGACFPTAPGMTALALRPLAAVDGKRVGTCGAKDRVEACLRESLASGKLKVADATGARERAYLERLAGPAK